MIQPMPTLSISSAQHAASKTYKSSGQTEAESDFKIFVEKSTDMDDEDTNAPNAASEKELSIDELKERMSRFISNVEEGILDEMDFSFLELIKAEFGENFLEKLSMLDQEDAIIVSFVGLPAQNPSIFTEAGKIAFALNRKMPTVPTKGNINHEGHATTPMISGDELPSGSDVSTSKENSLPRDAISTINMQRNDASQWKAQKTVQSNENYLPAFYDKKVPTLIETRAIVNGNAHTHATPSSEHPPLLTQMITPIIKSITQNGQTELSVILQPAELGRLKISLSGGENAQLNVNISADQQDTLGLLKRHLDQLRNSLVDLGFENLAFSFSQNTNAQTQLEEVGYITAENDTMPSDTALIPLTYMPASGPLKLDIRL
jgi:flagellar hook-length control protein FliK